MPGVGFAAGFCTRIRICDKQHNADKPTFFLGDSCMRGTVGDLNDSLRSISARDGGLAGMGCAFALTDDASGDCVAGRDILNY